MIFLSFNLLNWNFYVSIPSKSWWETFPCDQVRRQNNANLGREVEQVNETLRALAAKIAALGGLVAACHGDGSCGRLDYLMVGV